MTALMSLPDRDERTLLRELNHRMNNELASAINILSAAAVRAENSEVKLALTKIAEVLHKRADVHRALALPKRDGLIDAAEHIRKLGFVMSRSCLEAVGIRLALVADSLPLESDRCWRLALAVHELVTNAARHASFDGQDGAIRIELSFADPIGKCTIADNGSLSKRLKPAQGLRIVSELAKSLGGRIEYGSGAQFSSFLLVFPLTERERRANRVIVSRRTRGASQRKPMAPSQASGTKQTLDATAAVPVQPRTS